jgi:hypothetical protein
MDKVQKPNSPELLGSTTAGNCRPAEGVPWVTNTFHAACHLKKPCSVDRPIGLVSVVKKSQK